MMSSGSDDVVKLTTLCTPVQVVMMLSETIDKGSKEVDELNLQKKEIEEMWLAEKNKWRLAERVSPSLIS